MYKRDLSPAWDRPVKTEPPETRSGPNRFLIALACGGIGCGAGVLATVPAVLLAVASAGLGHGHYLLAR